MSQPKTDAANDKQAAPTQPKTDAANDKQAIYWVEGYGNVIAKSQEAAEKKAKQIAGKPAK